MEARPYQTGPSFWLTIQVLHGLCHRMSDRKALARAIAARTTPRFIEIKNEKRDRRPICDWSRRDALGRERAKAPIASPDRRLAADPKIAPTEADTQKESPAASSCARLVIGTGDR